MKTEWISVKKRLPKKEFELYLVWDKGNAEGMEIQIQAFINKFTSKVTHWMPLPPKP